MREKAREMMAGGAAVSAFVTCAAIKMPLVMGGALAVATYAGLRLLLHESRPATDKAAAAAFVKAAKEQVKGIWRASKGIPSGPFREEVSNLVTVSNKLIRCFEQHPERIAVASQFPGKLESLRAMVEGYVELLRYRNDTGAAEEALAKAEKVFPIAAEKFKALLVRLLEEDVVKLRADARAYEELIEFDV